MSHKHSSDHTSKSFPNGSCLRPGIQESDTGDSGDESEPTYRHYDNFETDVCLTQDEDEEPLGSSSPVIKVKELGGANLKPQTTPPEQPKRDVIIREGREPIPRDDFTMTSNNRSASSDTDTETEHAKGTGGHVTDDTTTTTSTSESEETQIWVPVSKRPSTKATNGNNTPNGSSNGSDASRPQSLIHKAGTSNPGNSFSTGSLTFMTSPPASQIDKASVTALEDRRGSKDSWNTFKTRVKKSVSPPKHLSLGLLRHDDRSGTITLDIRNVPNDSGLAQLQSENEQFTSENEIRPAYQSRQMSRTSYEARSFTDSLCITCSLIYMIFVTVAGAVFPVAEVYVREPKPALFEGFYVYLHVTSLVFLIYVYAFLLSLRTSLFKNNNSPMISTLTRNVTDNHVPRDRHIQQSGSFYLRVGVVGFGIGAMIKSGLQFGQYFGATASYYCGHVLYGVRPVLTLSFTFIQLYFVFLGSNVSFGIGAMIKSGLQFGQYFGATASYYCGHVLYGVRPVLTLSFTFIQLYFVFLGSNMLIYKYKNLARFGLMHMLGTNLCIWTENIVKETLRELSAMNQTQSLLNTSNDNDETGYFHPVTFCVDDSLMSDVVNTSFPYLYPCTVLYSLICASILYTMWNNIDKFIDKSQIHTNGSYRRSQGSNVDCTGSSKGLFLGIIVFVAIIIILITLFVLTRAQGFDQVAVRLEHVGDMAIFTLTTIALGLSFGRIYELRRITKRSQSIEEVLLVLSLFGIYGFCVANITAGAMATSRYHSRLMIASNCLHIIQTSIQTVFILDTMNKRALKRDHLRNKPGREFVTFLLACNLALFIMALFRNQQPNVDLLQTSFYGPVTWNIITHVTLPIIIFFRFMSSISLSIIWKNTWSSTHNAE